MNAEKDRIEDEGTETVDDGAPQRTATSTDRFTGAVSIGSEDGAPIQLATRGSQVVLTVPAIAGRDYVLSEEEAWCLARQLDLACRRVKRAA
ncbi:hypothetical protein [Metallibacterium sp.]